MRDNEFDKGVQEKMGEFRLQPSTPVWLEVERRIRERKRRRILFFWLCMTGLVLAGLGGWWMMNKEDHSSDITLSGKTNTNSNTTTHSNQDPVNKNTIEPGQGKGNAGKNEMEVVADKQPQDINNPSLHPQSNKRVSQEGQVAAGTRQKTNKISGTSSDQSQVDMLTGTGKKAKRINPKNKVQAIIEKGNPAPVTPVTQATTAPVVVTIQPAVVTAPDNKVIDASVKSGETISLIPKPADTAKVMASKTEQPSVAPSKSKVKKNGWQTGLLFAFGESKLTNGGIDLFANKSFDLYQSGGAVTGNNPGGITNNQSFADSIPLKGPAFHAGVYAKRKTGKKTAFSAGVNLAYYAGKQRVGTFVDSVRRSVPHLIQTPEMGFTGLAALPGIPTVIIIYRCPCCFTGS